MTASRLELPAGAGRVIASDVGRYGALGVETGGFLLALTGTGSVSTVAFAGTRGITRHRLRLQISEIALDQLFGFAEQHSSWVPAQFHSHAGKAFLSQTDREYGLRVPGFISAVIPEFTEPPEHPDAWTWWRFDGPDWNETSRPQAGSGDVRQVIFDEDGVRDK
jgi:hypothetical protein